MPYWSVYCYLCQGYIADALLECIPMTKRASAAFRSLSLAQPGGALACPYCGSLLGFDDAGRPQPPASGWPVFRYGRAELEVKKQADGEAATIAIEEWALRHRFTRPGTHLPFSMYIYAEQAPLDETVP